MILQDDIELENTKRKLASLQALLDAKTHPPRARAPTPVELIAVRSLQSTADQLRAEIREYEAVHQTA